jgi:hypothetical protein
MADFSSSDINEAKRRVREMQERAKSYSQGEQSPSLQEEKPKSESESASSASPFGVFDFLSDFMSGDDGSKGIILALILILAREKADNMLILALLYILL